MGCIEWCYIQRPITTQTTTFSTFCIAFHIFIVDGDRDFTYVYYSEC